MAVSVPWEEQLYPLWTWQEATWAVPWCVSLLCLYKGRVPWQCRTELSDWCLGLDRMEALLESPLWSGWAFVHQLLRPWHRQAGNTEPDSLCPLAFCMGSSASKFWVIPRQVADLQPGEGLGQPVGSFGCRTQRTSPDPPSRTEGRC